MVGFDWQLMVVGLEIAQDHFWFIFLSLDLYIDIEKLWEWWVHLNYNISIRSFFDHEFWIWLGPGTMDQDQDLCLTISTYHWFETLLVVFFSNYWAGKEVKWFSLMLYWLISLNWSFLEVSPNSAKFAWTRHPSKKINWCNFIPILDIFLALQLIVYSWIFICF